MANLKLKFKLSNLILYSIPVYKNIILIVFIHKSLPGKVFKDTWNKIIYRNSVQQ